MSNNKKKVVNNEEEKGIVIEEQKQVCGIVMPISEIDGLPKSHWDEVYNIIAESIDSAGFKPNLVSNSEDIGVIQKRIVQNLYENPIVVCDVSAKNPNVMFELGLRLAFDKATIIIKDDKTSYSFDTSPIEHLEYPRDLRFSKIRDFGDKLASKIESTHKKSIDDKEYSTFLKHFGTFKVAKIETEEVTKEDIIMDEVKSLRNLILRESHMRRQSIQERTRVSDTELISLVFKKSIEGDGKIEISESIKEISSMEGVERIVNVEDKMSTFRILIAVDDKTPKRMLMRELQYNFKNQVVSIS